MIRRVNLLDPQQTQLPQFDTAHLHIITGGPYQTSLTNSYVTAIQVIIISLLSYLIYILSTPNS